MSFRPQYAGVRPAYNNTDVDILNVVVQAATGGADGFSEAGTLYIALQGQNRVGYNKVTNLKLVNYDAGDEIVITIGADARNDAEDIHKFIISASLTSNVNTTYYLAVYNGYETDQETETSLPVSITLNADEHIKLNEVVANAASLPTGTNLIHGMGRGVTTTGKFYLYDYFSSATPDGSDILSATTGRWHSIGTLSTFVDSISTLPGCNTSLDTLDEDTDLLVNPPAYDLVGSRSTTLSYWISNPDTGISEVISTGTRIGIDVYVNNELKSRLFYGKFKIIFKGYVDLLTGELDTSNFDNSGDMLYIDEEVQYINGKSEALVLQKPLDPDMAFAFDIYMQASSYEFRNLVPNGASVSIYPFFYTQAGDYSPLGVVLGDVIYLAEHPEGRRIVPGSGRSVIALKGAGNVDNLQFPVVERITVNGLTANTANQKILIHGNGGCFYASPATAVPDTEALRALVSTEAGLSNASSWSSTITVTADKGINVVLNHPSDTLSVGLVRADYPDVIAYTEYGVFNPESVIVYLERQSNSTIYSYEFICTHQPTQEVTLSSLSGTTVGSIPTNSDNTFSLYAPGAVTLSENASGALPADTYRVRFLYSYDGNQVTKVSHSESDGCIAELNAKLSDLLSILSYWDIPIARADIRSIPSTSCRHGLERKITYEDEIKPVIYNALSTATDDGVIYFKPSNLTSLQSGRWVVQETGLEEDDVIDIVLPFILALG